MHSITRYHDISCGHRVVGHENKCRFLHGHNYRIHFTVEVTPGYTLDNLGRVVDFGVVKDKLCQWLEENWDHKFLYWENDSLIESVIRLASESEEDFSNLADSLVKLPFNPTAENLAEYLVTVIGPEMLPHFVKLTEVKIEETAKCSATYRKGEFY